MAVVFSMVEWICYGKHSDAKSDVTVVSGKYPIANIVGKEMQKKIFS